MNPDVILNYETINAIKFLNKLKNNQIILDNVSSEPVNYLRLELSFYVLQKLHRVDAYLNQYDKILYFHVPLQFHIFPLVQ